MIWIGVIIFLIGASINIATTNCNPRVVVGTFLVAAGTIIYVSVNHPIAFDAYKGQEKITLEITYKNDVPVDSVVVFKNKEK